MRDGILGVDRMGAHFLSINRMASDWQGNRPLPVFQDSMHDGVVFSGYGMLLQLDGHLLMG